ncbi:MAG: NAD-dependent epimerase/dehydratase family protein, partial [Thermodesulfobacteriota bacterium]
EYFRVNTEATEVLLRECRDAGVRRFVFVSTVAVKFDDIRRYPYARSKLAAEKSVARSGLDYAIVRPAIVIGPGSGTWDSLSRLALAPVCPIFGDGRTPIQPIYVDDLVRSIVSIVEEDALGGETLDLGGPEKVSIEEFIRRIHRSMRGRDPRVLHVPLGLLVPMLTVLETFAYSYLPFTVGQLASFRFDGTTAVNPLRAAGRGEMKGVDEMIGLASAHAKEAEREEAMKKECAALCRYLTGKGPTEYVTAKYIDGCRALALGEPADGFDAALLRVASLGAVFTRFADAYSSVLFRTSLVKKKLVLLLAILECTGYSDGLLRLREPVGRASLAGRMAARTGAFAATFAAASAAFLPLRAALGSGKGRKRARRDG